MFPVDGFTVLRRLRSLPQYAATPIFVLSAKTLSYEERKDLLALGIQFLAKPFRPRNLLQRILGEASS